MKKERNIAFIIELLLLFVLLLIVIVVITQTFMKSRSQSLYARHLTEAVTLAEEIAEVSASAADTGEAARLIDSLDQVLAVDSVTEDAISLEMRFDAKTGLRDTYHIDVDWTEEAASGTNHTAGRFIRKKIWVFLAEETEPIYTLEAGEYR